MTCRLGLTALICAVILMGCKKKDTAPEPQEAAAGIEQPLPQPEPETADADEEQDAMQTETKDAGPSDAGTKISSEQEVVIHFKGKVLWIKLLSKISGDVYPVGFDCRFAMKVAIEAVKEKGTPFGSGTAVVFAIHSPAKTFMTAADWKKIAGHKYDFELNAQKSAEGQWSYYFMMAKSAEK